MDESLWWTWASPTMWRCWLEEVTQSFGINISSRENELLYIGRNQGNVRVEDIALKSQMMKQVEEFTYLGSVKTGDGKFIQDIERMRAEATRASG